VASVTIEVGLKLIDAAQVGEGGVIARTHLTDARDHLRQVAVWVADLNHRHDHEGGDHQARDQSTGCVQPSDWFVEKRARASQASSR
jgi:hypothetical protein